MMFWAIGFLILLKLEYSIAVLAYSMVAFSAPILWLSLRRTAKIKFLVGTPLDVNKNNHVHIGL